MTTPLDEQLRQYFGAVDRLQGTTDLSTVLPDDAPTLRLVGRTGADGDVDGDVDGAAARGRRPVAPSRKRRAVLGVAAAIAALALGLTFVVVGTDDPEPTDRPPETDETVPPVEEPEPLGFTGSEIDGGRYRTSLLGVEAAFSLRGDFTVREANASSIALSQWPDLGGADDTPSRWIFLTRLGGWNSAAEAIDPDFRGVGTIPPGDLDRWLEENRIVVVDRRSTTVDGRTAEVVDVRVDAAVPGSPLDFPRDSFTLYNDSCVAGTAPCRWYRSIPAVSDVFPGGPRPDPVMHAGQARRMWLISIPGQLPILIEAVDDDGDGAWLDQVEADVVRTLDLGEPAPPLEAG